MTLRDRSSRVTRATLVGMVAILLKYHQVHVWKLKLLGSISGDPYLWRLALRLADDRKPRGYVPGRPAVRHRPS